MVKSTYFGVQILQILQIYILFRPNILVDFKEASRNFSKIPKEKLWKMLLEIFTAVFGISSYITFEKTEDYGNFRTNHRVSHKQGQVSWNMSSLHVIIACKIIQETHIHNEPKEINIYKAVLRDADVAFNGAENFINEWIGEICSHEKLSVE